jgi:hypothetical protein
LLAGGWLNEVQVQQHLRYDAVCERAFQNCKHQSKIQNLLKLLYF